MALWGEPAHTQRPWTLQWVGRAPTDTGRWRRVRKRHRGTPGRNPPPPPAGLSLCTPPGPPEPGRRRAERAPQVQAQGRGHTGVRGQAARPRAGRGRPGSGEVCAAPSVASGPLRRACRWHDLALAWGGQWLPGQACLHLLPRKWLPPSRAALTPPPALTHPSLPPGVSGSQPRTSTNLFGIPAVSPATPAKLHLPLGPAHPSEASCSRRRKLKGAGDRPGLPSGPERSGAHLAQSGEPTTGDGGLTREVGGMSDTGVREPTTAACGI